MAVFEVSISGMQEIPLKFVQLMRDGLLTISDSPRMVLRINGDTTPSIRWAGDHIHLEWKDAVLERKGKDCPVRNLEIREAEILIHLEWILGIDFDVLVRFI